MLKQIKFKEIASLATYGGILLEDGCVLCACCGGIFEADERGETWEIVEEYEDWVDFTETILGDENNMEVKNGS